MSKKLEKRVNVVVIEDDLEEYSCSGVEIGKRHPDAEFDFYMLRLINARANNCPHCGMRFVSFMTTFST